MSRPAVNRAPRLAEVARIFAVLGVLAVVSFVLGWFVTVGG